MCANLQFCGKSLTTKLFGNAVNRNFISLKRIMKIHLNTHYRTSQFSTKLSKDPSIFQTNLEVGGHQLMDLFRYGT